MSLVLSFFSCAIRLCCASLVAGGLAFAQTSTDAAQPNKALAPISKPSKPSQTTKPLWTELSAAQHLALSPLQAEWPKISAAQKHKWLEVSKNYGKLNAADQAKLHDRMSDWVKLSPEQRAQARLNFSAAKALPPEEKQKHWEAYQSLSPEEKMKLQAKAKANTPNSAALASKPQNNKVTTVSKHPTATATQLDALPANK